MADVRVEPQDEAVDIWITGELTIDTVGEIAGEFQAALEFKGPVKVYVDKATSFDLSGMQLCLALLRDAAARDISIEFVGNEVPERFRRMLKFTGLPEL